MSKAPSQEKTQQDLHKYWNSVTPNTATTNPNDKKRKASVQGNLQEETASPPSKRMHETTKNKDEFLRSSSSSNLQATTNLNPNPNLNTNPNPSWMVEMERRLENNLTINLTQNLRSIIDESVNKAIERVTASVNKIIEANPVIQTLSNAIAELQKGSTQTQTSVNRISKDQEELKAKLYIH